MARVSRTAGFVIIISRSVVEQDVIRYSVRKTWWQLGRGGDSRQLVAGVLEGMPQEISEAELLLLAVEAVLRRLRTLG